MESVGEMVHIPNTEHVFFSLHFCILSFHSLFSCTCRLEAFIKKPVSMWKEVGLCVAPALAQDSGMCSRERKSSLCSQNGKRIHLTTFQTGIYSFLSCSSHSRTVTSVTVQQVMVLSSLTGSDFSVTAVVEQCRGGEGSNRCT